jgi:hypothetical protein
MDAEGLWFWVPYLDCDDVVFEAERPISISNIEGYEQFNLLNDSIFLDLHILLEIHGVFL